MPSQSTAPGSDSPRVPSPQVLAGHVVCSRASHDDLKVTVRTWLEYKTHWPEALPSWLSALLAEDAYDLAAFLASKRPWPGTTLLVWECGRCLSTLAVCGDCRDDGVIETGSGPGAHEEQCSCVFAEAA